jgi:hypothetical protein
VISFPCVCGCGHTLSSRDEPQTLANPNPILHRDGLWIWAYCNRQHGGCSYHGWHRVDEAMAAIAIKPTRRLRPSPLALRAA